MSKDECIYAIIDIPIFIVKAWFACTILNSEYLLDG